MKRRAVDLVLFAVAVALCLLVIRGARKHLFTPAPGPTGMYAGWTEDDLLRAWGQPGAAFDGHYGAPPDDFTQQYPIARTLVFRRLTGSLYVSLRPVDGRWVCFCSDWLPAGGAF